jgi:hypothetical protein
MSIKKPSMIKPNIKKPSVAKKPAAPVKPAIAEEVQAAVEEVVEEKVVEPIVIVEDPIDVAPELLEQMIEEENQKLEEQDAMEEPVVEEVKEEKPKAKKSSKKSKAKKEEPKVEEEPQEQLPQMSLEDSIDAMADTVNITTEDWEEAKQEIEDKLKALTIDPDMNPATMKHLIGDLDDLMTELRFRLVDIEGQVEFINAQVDYIRSTNSKGSNAEERKANAFLALTNFKKNPDDTEVINLIQYQIFMNNKLNFLNKSIETVRDRRQLLITFNSCMKIESTF